MKKICLFVMVLAMGYVAQAQAPKVYDENLDAMKQIREATELARETGRYVMCQVGGN